jgi:hypothetical protein
MEELTSQTFSEENQAPEPSAPVNPEETNPSKKPLYVTIAVVVVVVLLLGAGLFFLFRATPAEASHVRDLFIIFMALESLVIGVALVVLITQLAVLINLLQNEIKPIINSTNETVNTLRGTATFISDNLAEPVIKLNEYVAVLKRLVDLLKIGRR